MDDSFRIELHATLSKYAKQYGLNEKDCELLALTLCNVVKGGAELKIDFYQIMSEFSMEQVKKTKQRAEAILATLNITDEGKEAIRQKAALLAKKKVAGTKIEN